MELCSRAYGKRSTSNDFPMYIDDDNGNIEDM